MNFLSPLFFWSFLSLVPLALIYLLKVRPRRKPTTAYFLWEDIFQERRPNRLLERLRDFWSLLLMALAFCAVCLALTRPEVGEDQRKDVLLLIDNSASMSTLDGDQTRLDAAKQVATDILRAFNGNQRAAVASVAYDIEYESHISDNPRELMEAVAAVEATDYEFRVDQFSNLSQAKDDSADPDGAPTASTAEDAASRSEQNVSQEGESATGQGRDWLDGQRVVLISDGCFDTSQLPDRVELLKVGTANNNVGIVAADLRRLPSASDTLGLYLQLHSTHAEAKSVDLLVYEGREESNLFRLIPLDVQPG